MGKETETETSSATAGGGGGNSSAVKMTVEECQRMIQKSLRTPVVKFLRERMEKSCCGVSEKSFKAINCDESVGGGYVPGEGVVVCSNHMNAQEDVNQVVIHALIHAYVDCRAKIDWSGVKGGRTVAEGEVMIQKGLRDPKVKFMREQLEKAGCRITDNFFKSVRCKWPISGTFLDKIGEIHVCSNNLTYQDEVTQVLIHELIHAYDHCRAKNLDWNNGAHRACSEIRANRLSGDCHFMRELLRGNVNIKGQEQACIKRRVIYSMCFCSNPRARDAALLDLESVWDICYNDTSPFDKVV